VATKLTVGLSKNQNLFFKTSHVKDAAQDVAKDVMGAAEDRSAKMLIVVSVIFQRRNPRLSHAYRPTLPLGGTYRTGA